tara:strand:+ start:304 stop:441 length:138 start_codon:yes stop_codon:yes gene_type:complete
MSADPKKRKKLSEKDTVTAKVIIVVGMLTLTIWGTFWLARWLPVS